MSRVIVDSGAWIALLNARDSHHDRARAYLESHAKLLTINYVVDEAATRLRYDGGLAAALGLRALLDRLVREGRLRVVWIDARLEHEAWGLLEKHADLPLSLTDAATAAVARRHKLRRVFGFDFGFRALGFAVEPEG